MRWNRNRFSHSGKKEAWFSFDRFRVTQASASKPRKPAVSSLVGSNGKGFEPALPGERQALEAQQFEPVRVSLPRQQFLGELADPFGTAAAHEHAWFRKNCSKSRSASPRWRRRKKYRRNWKFRFSTIQLAPRPRAGPHATRCPRRPPRSRDRALAGQRPARNDAPKRYSHGGEARPATARSVQQTPNRRLDASAHVARAQICGSCRASEPGDSRAQRPLVPYMNHGPGKSAARPSIPGTFGRVLNLSAFDARTEPSS